MKKVTLLICIILLLFFISSSFISNTPIVMQPMDKVVEGHYLSEPMDGETERCDISLRIEKVQRKYFYAIIIGGKTIKGKVKLSPGDDAGSLGITLEGIKWAENNGDLSTENKQNKLTLPQGLDGVWTESGIMIQNYGNSMNNYTKIAGCGQKYINLIKQ